jgi:alanine racemase
VCVGTVHELDHLAGGVTPVVLTPTLLAPACAAAVLTVDSPAQVAGLGGWTGRVVVKLRSSMQRYGVAPDGFAELVDAIRATALEIDGAAIHLPLAGDDAGRRAEIEAWLPVVPTRWSLSVSHLAPESLAALRADHPGRRFELRAGTALWHGDKSFLQLTSDVVETRPVAAGTRAGYQAAVVPEDGTLVLIGAGSAHGVVPLADGRSPFHFARERITLIEPPHMHTSIGIVPRDRRAPSDGDRVDVQRPLITTFVDELEWQP